MEVSDLLALPHPNDRKPHMHTKLLSRWLADRTVIGHATRAALLVRVVRALLTGGKLSLTHLGRSLDGAAQMKHRSIRSRRSIACLETGTCMLSGTASTERSLGRS